MAQAAVTNCKCHLGLRTQSRLGQNQLRWCPKHGLKDCCVGVCSVVYRICFGPSLCFWTLWLVQAINGILQNCLIGPCGVCNVLLVFETCSWPLLLPTFSLSLFLSSLYVFCFSSTLWETPEAEFPPHILILTRRNIKKINLIFFRLKADFSLFFLLFMVSLGNP